MTYIWKDRETVSICRWYDYLENPKKSTGQLLVCRFTGYKINRQKSMKFLVVKEENADNE